MPQPTVAQIALIERLGDDIFQTREKASVDLMKSGRGALLALERYGANHADPEISHRSRHLITRFYNVGSSHNTLPPCYGLFRLKEVSLPSGKTFEVPDGMARSYFEAHGGDVNVNQWNDDLAISDTYAFNATSTLVRQMLRSGYSTEDVTALLDSMEKNVEKHHWSAVDMKCEEDELEEGGQCRYPRRGG